MAKQNRKNAKKLYMKDFLKRTIPILVILLIAGLGFFGYRYATANLKTYLSNFSEDNLNARVSIGSVGIGLPFSLELRDVEINDSIDIRKMRIYPSFYRGLRARFSANDVRLDKKGIGKFRVDLKGIARISKNNLTAKCFLEGKAVPLAGSFILLADFKHKLVKIKNLQSNFLELVLDNLSIEPTVGVAQLGSEH